MTLTTTVIINLIFFKLQNLNFTKRRYPTLPKDINESLYIYVVKGSFRDLPKNFI